MAKESADRFHDTIILGGIPRWSTNNSVPPTDLLELWAHLGRPFDYEKAIAKHDEEVRESIKEYERWERDREQSLEELYEMRAAFGEGATVVNVLTGRETKI
jgi:hypothetical protein